MRDFCIIKNFFLKQSFLSLVRKSSSLYFVFLLLLGACHSSPVTQKDTILSGLESAADSSHFEISFDEDFDSLQAIAVEQVKRSRGDYAGEFLANKNSKMEMEVDFPWKKGFELFLEVKQSAFHLTGKDHDGLENRFFSIEDVAYIFFQRHESGRIEIGQSFACHTGRWLTQKTEVPHLDTFTSIKTVLDNQLQRLSFYINEEEVQSAHAVEASDCQGLRIASQDFWKLQFGGQPIFNGDFQMDDFSLSSGDLKEVVSSTKINPPTPLEPSPLFTNHSQLEALQLKIQQGHEQTKEVFERMAFFTFGRDHAWLSNPGDQLGIPDQWPLPDEFPGDPHKNGCDAKILIENQSRLVNKYMTDIRGIEDMLIRSALYAQLEIGGDEPSIIIPRFDGNPGFREVPSSKTMKDVAKKALLRITKWNSWNWGCGSVHLGDLNLSHLLVGVSTAYSWLYPYFTSLERKQIEEKLFSEGNILFEKWLQSPLYQNSVQGSFNFLVRNYYNNHYWWALSAIFLTAKVLQGRFPEVNRWSNFSKNKFWLILDEFLPEDGSWHEGFFYHAYALRPLLYFIENLEPSIKPLYYKTPWLRQTAFFRASLLAPDGLRTACFSNDPCIYDGRGAPLLFRLASEYQDSKIQAQAWQSFLTQPDRGLLKYHFLSLLWLDSDLRMDESRREEPLSAFFKDLGVVTSKSFKKKSLLSFKSGTPGGENPGRYYLNHLTEDRQTQTHLKMLSTNGTHDQPDQNSFSYFVGSDFIIRDTGFYRSPQSGQVANHSQAENTVTVYLPSEEDSLEVGQSDDRYFTNWKRLDLWERIRGYMAIPLIRTPEDDLRIPRGHLKILQDDFENFMVQGEAQETYPEELKMDLFKRTLIQNRLTNDLLIEDELEFAVARQVVWHFHFVGRAALSESNQIEIHRGDDVFRFSIPEDRSHLEINNFQIEDPSHPLYGKEFTLQEPLYRGANSHFSYLRITSPLKNKHFYLWNLERVSP